MPRSVTSVYVNGKPLEGWSAMKWDSSLESIADKLEISMQGSLGRGIRGGEELIARVDAQTFFTGYVEVVEVKYSSGAGLTTISGRSKCSDVVDSSVDLELIAGELANVTVADIAFEYSLDWLGVRFRDLAGDLPRIPKVSVQTGETVFEILERHARQAGVLLRAMPDGTFSIERVGRTRAAEALVLGGNMTGFSMKTDLTGRFHSNKVVGQSTESEDWDSEPSVGASGEAIDELIRDRKMRVTTASGPATAEECQRQANWQAAVNKARSATFSASVQGWLSGGSIWTPNTITPIDTGSLGLNAELLIRSVSLGLAANSGYKGALVLVDPSAYTPEPVIEDTSDDLLNRARELGWE